MKALHCAIKREYLDLIQAGTKNVEYRDMSPYWVQRLVEIPANGDIEQCRSDIISGKVEPNFKKYTHIVFHCNGTTVTMPILGIKTYRGHHLFVISLDNRQKENK
ncbi:MAG: ASCH domain-containing protein [Paludibacteraceae bacterium]|nr:ASCH domain-containing protein [Paludibacteraceae bacterium]